MFKHNAALMLIFMAIFITSGCTVRVYKMTKERVDQELSSGNRGYIKGEAKEGIPERKAFRDVNVVEVELGQPVVKELPAESSVASRSQISEDSETYGNKGYIFRSVTPQEDLSAASGNENVSIQEYTVQNGDTLQKISQRFYGTTRRWKKIYEFNSDILKGPDKIYPGQKIRLPLEGLKEPRENLK